MTVLDRSALAPQSLPGKRRVAGLAGLALMASIALLLRRVAPGSPATVSIALVGLPALSVAALAFTLEDEALPKLAHGVLAGVGFIVLVGRFSQIDG